MNPGAIGTAITLPAIGSVWSHRARGTLYTVLGFTNMREPAKPGFPPTIRYVDGDGYEYSAPLDGWHARMAWSANPIPAGRPIDPDRLRRETELLAASNREVERRRAAERQAKELDRLRRAVARATGTIDGLPDSFAFSIHWCPDGDPDAGDAYITAGMIRRAAAAMVAP